MHGERQTQRRNSEDKFGEGLPMGIPRVIQGKKSPRVHRMEQYPTRRIQVGNSEEGFRRRNGTSISMKMGKSTLDFLGVLADFRGAIPTRDANEEVRVDF